MDYSVIIPAAGTATRMKLGFNKVLFKLNDQTVIEKTVGVFLNDKKCKNIIVCVGQSDFETVSALFKDKRVNVQVGGETRSHSVYNGLKFIDTDIVLVHDGARPNLTQQVINRVRAKVEDGFYSVIPTITPIDAVLINGHRNSETKVKLVQTPQGFKTHQLKKAYDQAFKEKKLTVFKDDSAIIEKYFGYAPAEVEGDVDNIKITNPVDLKVIK